MCRMCDGILICCSWLRDNPEGSIPWSAAVSSPPEGTASPRLKSLLSLSCLYFLAPWQILNWWLEVLWSIFSMEVFFFFSTRITQFYISAKHCRLCNSEQILICSSFHSSILLQEWFLFWKGTMTSFCKVFIRNFPEVLPLPKAQEACSALQFLPWHTEDILSSLSVWLGWRLVAFPRSFPYCLYSHSAPTVSKIKEPSWEQLMEFAWLFPWGSSWLSEESPGSQGGVCLEQPHPGQI